MRPEFFVRYRSSDLSHNETPVPTGDPNPRNERESLFRRKLIRNLATVYGDERAPEIFDSIKRIIDEGRGLIPERPKKPEGQLFSQDNMILITFPHQLQRGSEPIQNHERKKGDFTEWKGEPTLQTKRRFLKEHVGDAVDTVHELPFNTVNEKWGDRGFSQVNRFVVQPEYGTWTDIAAIGKEYNLMADLVVGHIDIDSPEFRAFLSGDPKYQNYFIWWRPEDLDKEHEKTGKTVRELIEGVRRPRTHYWLTDFETTDGKKEVRKVVTTFSERQVDLNYGDPRVFEDVVRVAMKNLQNGVNVFRFDAITYMTKLLGTECVNLPNNYVFLEMFRDIIKELNPDAIIITETNVPHKENVSYFGNGENGADAAYNFPLPMSVLDAFRRGQANHLYTVLDRMSEVPDAAKNTWLNVLSTHDGIGVKGAIGILSDDEIKGVQQQVEANGGKVSNGAVNGKESVYELNSTYWSALNGHIEDFDTALTRMKTAQRILNSIPGISGHYILQLLGMENYQVPFKSQNKPFAMNRDINEQKLNYDEVHAQLLDPKSKMSRIFTALTDINRERKQYSALHPTAPIRPLPDLDPRVFAFTRGGPDEPNVLALHNLSGEAIDIMWKGNIYHLEPYDSSWTPIQPENYEKPKENDVFQRAA